MKNDHPDHDHPISCSFCKGVEKISTSGGESFGLQYELKTVQMIQASQRAFAAILGDGSVVTWGHGNLGGNSSAVRHQLKDVQQVASTHYAFAALRGDGSVVSWGHPDFGGDSFAVED